LRGEFLLNDFIPRQQILSWGPLAGEQYFSIVDGAIDESEFVSQVNQWQASLSFSAVNNVGQLFKVVHFTGTEKTPDRLLIMV